MMPGTSTLNAIANPACRKRTIAHFLHQKHTIVHLLQALRQMCDSAPFPGLRICKSPGRNLTSAGKRRTIANLMQDLREMRDSASFPLGIIDNAPPFRKSSTGDLIAWKAQSSAAFAFSASRVTPRFRPENSKKTGPHEAQDVGP